MAKPPALFFMARPPANVRAAMQAALATHRLDLRLGPDLFPAEHWHQSLSDLFDAGAATRERLLRAGDRVTATAFPMQFNRVYGNAALRGRIHWSFVARGIPAGFRELLTAIRAALTAEGAPVTGMNTAHVTISYGAPETLPAVTIVPIAWHIEEFMLVERQDDPFRYIELARWALKPAEANEGFQFALL